MTSLLSDALRNVAMIAEIDTSALGLTRTDTSASKKADVDHGAAVDAGRVVVKRFAGVEELPKRIMDIQKQVHDNLKSHSTAWGNGKRRLLPNTNFAPWIKRHTELKDSFDGAVANFVENADDIISRAKANLGTYDVDLPTKEEIARAYSLSYALEPVPDAGHFKGDVAVADYLREQFERNMQAAYQDAQQDALRRLADPLGKLVERMEAYEGREREIANGADPKAVKGGIFRDTIVTNVQEIAAVFGSFNLLGDPRLQEIADKLAPFNHITPDVLRQRGDIRGAAAAKAKQILADLDDLLVR